MHLFRFPGKPPVSGRPAWVAALLMVKGGAYAKLAYCKRTARERRRGGNRVVNLINDFCHQMEQGAGHREGSVPDCVESYVVGERFLPWKISGAPWRETELPQIFIDVRDK